MPATVTPWPESLAGTPAVAVLDQALARHRLAHSLLLQGDDPELLSAVAHALAGRLLNDSRPVGVAQPRDRAGQSQDQPAPDVPSFPPEKHPDFIAVRPSGKMRQIRVETFDQFLGQIQLSPGLSRRKVAVVFEADRLNAATANKFLKTLEEPPASTTILLVTTRPHDLLPTIRSRCQRFSFRLGAARPVQADLPAWLADYRAWLERLSKGVPDKKTVCDHIFTLYGLVTRFQGILAAATAEVWKAQQEKLPAALDEDEAEAIETGIANGLRLRLFTEIEQATRAFAQERIADGAAAARRALVTAVEKLEHNAGLLRLNLNEAAALEDFLLSSLRIWTKR